MPKVRNGKLEESNKENRYFEMFSFFIKLISKKWILITVEYPTVLKEKLTFCFPPLNVQDCDRVWNLFINSFPNIGLKLSEEDKELVSMSSDCGLEIKCPHGYQSGTNIPLHVNKHYHLDVIFIITFVWIGTLYFIKEKDCNVLRMKCKFAFYIHLDIENIERKRQPLVYCSDFMDLR